MSNPRMDLHARRSSFLSKADEYERYRPGYPAAAVEWVIGRSSRRVIDVGCGPGNLTSQLAEVGHEVVGVDPSPNMLERARKKGLRVVLAAAELLPFGDACADVVTAATAFHWFDADRAVPEMRRVLGPDGIVGLLTNIRDERVPWIGALSEIIGSEAAMAVKLGGAEGMEAEFVSTLERGGLFRATEHRIFDHEQVLRPEELVGLVRSRSYIAILPDAERKRLLGAIRELCREHPDLRGKDTFLMPYKTHAFRSWAC